MASDYRTKRLVLAAIWATSVAGGCQSQEHTVADDVTDGAGVSARARDDVSAASAEEESIAGFIEQFVPVFFDLPTVFKEEPLTEKELRRYVDVAAALQRCSHAAEAAFAAVEAAFNLGGSPIGWNEYECRLAVLLRLMFVFPTDPDWPWAGPQGFYRLGLWLEFAPIAPQYADFARSPSSPILWENGLPRMVAVRPAKPTGGGGGGARAATMLSLFKERAMQRDLRALPWVPQHADCTSLLRGWGDPETWDSEDEP